MKRIITVSLFAVAAMASVSCESLEVNQETPGLRVPAVINATAGAGTRATIDGLQVSWEAGDKISVFDATGKAEGAFTANASGTSVVFTGTKEEGDVLKYAVCPANGSATCAAGVFTTTIPGEQDGTINNSLSIAEEKDGRFVFLNAASVIKITIPAEETAINFVAFLADNNAAIAGDVTADMNDLTAVASTSEGAVKYSRVSVYRDGQPLSGDLYLTVIPGEYSGTIVFGKKDGTVRYAATVKVAAKKYTVNRIKNFGTVANLTWVKGAVPGVFSLDASGKRALMSQGYIRYDAATDTWSIADTFTRLTSFNASGVIELFRWNNADTPTGANTHASDGWIETGDWAKKLDQSGWRIGTWSDYEFCFRNPNSSDHGNREKSRLVSKCVSIVKVAAGEYYTILYPDGWAGDIASFESGTQTPSTEMTYDELKTLEDKGCAIFGHGGTLNNKSTWTLASDPQMNLWTTVWESSSKVYSFRILYKSGWKREPNGVAPAYGYCARPYYEISYPDSPNPPGEDPKLPEGAVLWLDLTSWNNVSASDADMVGKMWDNLHVSATLQGVVNRESPVLYLNYVRADGYNTDEYWWNKYSAPDEWLAGRELVNTTDPIRACELLKDRFEGLVVYDPKVPATSCVASMVAGVDNLVAVRYDTSEGSCYNRLVELGIPVKVWLVGEDGTSMFSSKTAVYRWAIDNYLKPGKCNTEYAGYYIDQCWLKNPGAAVINHHLLSNHDFFVSKRAFFFDLSPWPDEVATDDPSGSLGGDYETLKEILLECYHQNGNGETFCHIGGFPAWAFKYTNFGTVGGNHTPVQTEWKFAEIIGEYNAFKDADAISYGALANASFWQHFPLRTSYPQSWTTHKALQDKGYLDANGKVDRSKRYVLLYVGDFDAASWIYQTTPSLWDNPQRGQVPMMWSVSPILARRAPQVMHYLWTTATENDYFAAADNGAGYLNPGSLEEPRAISGLPSGMQQWARHCKPWYEKWGITVTGFIIDGNAKGMSQDGFKAYAGFSPNGIVPQKVSEYISAVDGMPILRAGGSANYDLPSEAASAIRNTMGQHTDRPFYWFRAILKSPAWYVSVKGLLEQSNPEIVWMSAPDYFELMKCYLEEQ